jgi:hypothetical protein
MELSPYVTKLQQQLVAAAQMGSDQVRETAGQLAGALDAAARMALLEALGQAAAEITAETAPTRVEMRLTPGGAEFTAVAPAPEASPDGVGEDTDGEDTATDADQGATARLTLRLPESLKARAEAAAAEAGQSVNATLVHAIDTWLTRRDRRRGGCGCGCGCHGEHGGHSHGSHRGPRGEWDAWGRFGWDSGDHPTSDSHFTGWVN